MSLRTEDLSGHKSWGFGNYLNFFKEPIYWLTFVRTAVYSILVTVMTFIVTMPVAFYITKVVAPRFQGFLMMLLLMPFWVSELVRVYGWMILLRESGVLNHFLVQLGLLQRPVEMLYNDVTMVMGLVYTSMLFMVVPLVSVLESLDDSLIEAAYDLGANMVTICPAHHHSPCHARHRLRLHRGLHADPGQLPDPEPDGRQELPVVHRADLQPVHRQLQLEPGLGLRLPAAGPVVRWSSGWG